MAPRRAMSPCAEPGCPELTRNTRCVAHQRGVEKKWKNPERIKVYQSRRWRGLRRDVLREQPWCQMCGVNVATDVDHIAALRDEGDPYDRSNVQALCKRCHSRKTAQETWGRK